MVFGVVAILVFPILGVNPNEDNMLGKAVKDVVFLGLT